MGDLKNYQYAYPVGYILVCESASDSEKVRCVHHKRNFRRIPRPTPAWVYRSFYLAPDPDRHSKSDGPLSAITVAL